MNIYFQQSVSGRGFEFAQYIKHIMVHTFALAAINHNLAAWSEFLQSCSKTGLVQKSQMFVQPDIGRDFILLFNCKTGSAQMFLQDKKQADAQTYGYADQQIAEQNRSDGD